MSEAILQPNMKKRKYDSIQKGQKFGLLTVIERFREPYVHPSTGIRVPYFTCLCECGKLKEIGAYHLLNGATNSCGCLGATNRRTHGLCGSPEYKVWCHIKDRCQNPKNKSFKDYGGRGITMCARWETFESFFEDMGLKPEGMSIDRIDNSKGYSPENCRWASREIQNRNKRSNVVITFNGKSQHLEDWASEIGITPGSLSYRLKHWSLELALTSSPKPGRSRR